MILSQLLNWSLLCCEILCLKNLLCPPFVTGSCAEHASHQMIASICMTERMKCVIFVHTKVFTGNKHSSGCSKRNITLTVTNCTCSYSSCRIVTCTCNNFYILTESKFFRNLRFQSSYSLPNSHYSFGSCSSVIPQISSISFDQQRFFTSRRSIPEASETSVQKEPDRRYAR